MFTLYLIVLLFPHIFCQHRLSSDWETWKQIHGKYYNTSEEETYRIKIWEKNRDFVFNHNNRSDRRFSVELNQFADQAPIHRRHFTRPHRKQTDQVLHFDNNLTFLPSQFDWRSRGAITPVRNQGQMGSSQTFAATECVESYNFIKNGKLVELSEQETQDCCGSRLVYPIFTCLHNIGGLCSEKDYPVSTGNHTCHNASCTPVVEINGGKTVPSGNEELLLKAVLQMPVMVSVDASHSSFQLYKSGIYDEPNCSSTRIDHTMQVVGYGTNGSGQDYWIVKNTWGINWGMNGYILMSRNKNNQCGIATKAMYPY